MPVPAWVAKFYVFDLKYGKREENSHEKVLFYYPPAEDQKAEQKKQRDVGLSEALINFTRQFSPEKPVDVVHTDKLHYVYREVEPGTWIVLAATRHAGTSTLKEKRSEPTKDGSGRRPVEDSVNDSVLKNAVKHAYGFFRFFNGSINKSARRPQTHARVRTHARTHTHTHARAPATHNTHARMHARTPTRTHALTHVSVYSTQRVLRCIVQPRHDNRARRALQTAGVVLRAVRTDALHFPKENKAHLGPSAQSFDAPTTMRCSCTAPVEPSSRISCACTRKGTERAEPE